MVMHSSSVRGAGNRADWLMNFGTSPAKHPKKFIFVVVNADAVTTLTPFANTSIEVPFHFIATFAVSVRVA
jgi:hypothetical protein